MLEYIPLYSTIIFFQYLSSIAKASLMDMAKGLCCNIEPNGKHLLDKLENSHRLIAVLMQ